MRRLHAAKDDLDWLPERYRLLRGVIVGGVWATIGGGLAAGMMFGAHVFIFGKAFVAIGAGGYWLGDRVSKGVVSRRLGKLASGRVDLARLSNSEDGELVHVRGVVRATTTLPSLLAGEPCVYRRVRATFANVQAIEEQAVDFQLVDGDGNAIFVEADSARWLVNDARQKQVPSSRLEAFRELPAVAKAVARTRTGYRKRAANVTTRATEALLRDGDEVEVVGYKSRKVDPTVVDRLARETPMRATLRGGKELPVMISRVKAAS